jgi:hypothetical protein
MGFEYKRRAIGSVGGLQVPVQSVSSTATVVNGVGASLITVSTDDRTYLLGRPARAGVVKYVVLDTPAASTDNAVLRLESTADTFWGTTFQTLTVSTASDGPNVLASVTLVGASTTQWALVAKSTGLTLS